MSPVFVVGRFPPPLDGQTLATERLAELVGEARSVVRVSTSAPEGDRAGDDRGAVESGAAPATTSAPAGASASDWPPRPARPSYGRRSRPTPSATPATC